MHESSPAAAPRDRTGSPSVPTLRRSLTLTHAVLYGLGVTVGAGIYVLIAAAAERAGMHAPVAFVFTAVLIGLTGASLSELGVRMPVAAGEAAYARAAFRSDRWATAVGLLVIAVALVSGSTISVGAAGYIGVFVPAPELVIIAFVVLAMGAIAARGVVESVTFAGVMTLIELGGLMAVVVLGFIYEPEVLPRASEMLPLTLEAEAWSGIVTASLLAVFAFIGFEGIVNIAEELEEPEKNLPRAIFLTLVITTVLYVLVMWIALAALGVDELAQSKAPLALVFSHLSGLSPKTMSAIAVVATLNGIVVNLIMASRVMYGLSRQGSLPAAFGAVNATTRTPLFSTAVSTVVILFFALLLPIANLADISARLTLAMFAIVNLALYVLKTRDDPHGPRPRFSVPRWVPLAGFMSCVLFIAADLLIWIR